MFNNGTLGFVELEMKASGFLDTGVDLHNPDFAAMAEAVGVRTSASRIRTSCEAGVARSGHDGPALLDVVTPGRNW